MPQTFDSQGLRFQYPEGWKPETESTPEGALSVTVRSPSEAFWTATSYPRTEPGQMLADTVVEAMRQEYPGLESDPFEGPMLAGHPVTGHDLNFWYLDLTNSAAVRVVSTLSLHYLFFWQAEDREFGTIEPVFQAMAESLLRESAGPAGA